MIRTIASVGSLVAVLALGACATPAPIAEPTPTPSVTATAEPSASPTDSGALSFPSIEDLKAAVEAAGISCTSWVQENAVQLASASGWCDGAWGLSTYASNDDRNGVLQLNKDSMEGGFFVYGDGWLIGGAEQFGASDFEQLAQKLGATAWSPQDELPS
jgi:hypothetical protein